LIHRRIFPVEIRVSRDASGTVYRPVFRRLGSGACTTANEAVPTPVCNQTLSRTVRTESTVPEAKYFGALVRN
jgi:hypothetical protein